MKFDELFDIGPAKDLSPDNEFGRKALAVQDAFTELVDMLRNPETFPDPHVNLLMALTWELVGDKVVPVACVDGIPTLGFYFEREGERQVALFTCPPDWSEQVKNTPGATISGLVWAASQCRDVYNDRFDDNDTLKRAFAYEAQCLLTLQKMPGFEANDYQRKVLADYPKGVASPVGVMYVGKPYNGFR